MTTLVRCEGCGHPRRHGVWDGDLIVTGAPTLTLLTRTDLFADALAVMLTSGDVAALRPVHYSACDKHCTHGGPLRAKHPGEREWEHWDHLRLPVPPETYERAQVQASWRPVAEHDGRLLCLTCHAAQRKEPHEHH